jgi:PleD family two-component response regulator
MMDDGGPDGMAPQERSTRVLAVDDDAQIRRALSVILRTRGYEVELAVSAEDALSRASIIRPTS